MSDNIFFHIMKDFKLRKLEGSISEVVILINEVVTVYKFSNLLHQGYSRTLGLGKVLMRYYFDHCVK